MIASIQEMSSNTTQQLRVSSRRAPRTRRSWQPRGLIVLRLVVSAYLLQCATADVIGPNTDSFSPTFRELIERLNRSEGRPAVQSTMPSGTRRRLGWYRKGKKFMKNVASLADAGLMALDDMTDEAWEDVKEATATGANALKAAVAKAKKLAKNTGKRAAQAADTMLTQIDNTVSDLYDEVEAGIDEWRDDQALDNAEDWFWPDYASKLGSYYCDNHHGVRSMWGSMDAHTYPVGRRDSGDMVPQRNWSDSVETPSAPPARVTPGPPPGPPPSAPRPRYLSQVAPQPRMVYPRAYNQYMQPMMTNTQYRQPVMRYMQPMVYRQPQRQNIMVFRNGKCVSQNGAAPASNVRVIYRR